ncbi:MAG TPA: DUF3649 domain-containing protein [Nitrospirales bacterium]|nr:DUF3649 domain-containing protein [Nitrospirales bacterium]
MTSRVAAGVLGGYTLAYVCTAFMSIVLPLAKSEAVLTASMMSFVIYTGAILWTFTAATPLRAWSGLLIPTAFFGGITWVMA